MKSSQDKLSLFNWLIQKYQRKIYWHVRKMVVSHDDADDLTQEVFLKVWQGLDNFRGDSQLFTWIYRIATNECLNFLRNKRKMQFCEIEDFSEVFASDHNHDVLISGDDIQLALQNAIMTLPDKQRLVFNMRYFNELTNEQIAEIMQVHIGTVKTQYHHAVKKIENYLKKHSTFL